LVVDGSEPPCEEDRGVASRIEGRRPLVVVNKSDLPPASDYVDLLPDSRHLSLSALTGDGISELEGAMVDSVLTGQVLVDGSPISTNPRHRDLFGQALAHVREARAALEEGVPDDLIAIDVHEAVQLLGEITGETATEDLLDTIFADFCIGK
jgi:tRNA modification GTPase